MGEQLDPGSGFVGRGSSNSSRDCYEPDFLSLDDMVKICYRKSCAGKFAMSAVVLARVECTGVRDTLRLLPLRSLWQTEALNTYC